MDSKEKTALRKMLLEGIKKPNLSKVIRRLRERREDVVTQSEELVTDEGNMSYTIEMHLDEEEQEAYGPYDSESPGVFPISVVTTYVFGEPDEELLDYIEDELDGIEDLDEWVDAVKAIVVEEFSLGETDDVVEWESKEPPYEFVLRMEALPDQDTEPEDYE